MTYVCPTTWTTVTHENIQTERKLQIQNKVTTLSQFTTNKHWLVRTPTNLEIINPASTEEPPENDAHTPFSHAGSSDFGSSSRWCFCESFRATKQTRYLRNVRSWRRVGMVNSPPREHLGCSIQPGLDAWQEILFFWDGQRARFDECLRWSICR